MYQVCVLGAGKIGEAIATILSESGDYQIKLADADPKRARQVASGLKNTSGFGIDPSNIKATVKLLTDCQAVLSALPFYCNKDVATAALKAGVHYLDLTEDVSITRQVIELSKTSKKSFLPQCGLAPGFISIAAAHMISLFDKVETLKMRVGALPLFPTNRLKYNMTWSTEGLINEYCNPCEAIDNGQKVSLQPLESYETFSLNGDSYEAFNTSGGLGTLVNTMSGKVKKLDYKSIRYKGHREYMAFLLHDLGFINDRKALRDILDRNIPSTPQDKCLILVEATGYNGDRLLQRTYASTIYSTHIGGRHLTAIQVTTAAGILAPLDMLLSGKLKQRAGLIRSEEISLKEFLDNRFGRYYRDELALKALV